MREKYQQDLDALNEYYEKWDEERKRENKIATEQAALIRQEEEASAPAKKAAAEKVKLEKYKRNYKRALKVNQFFEKSAKVFIIISLAPVIFMMGTVIALTAGMLVLPLLEIGTVICGLVGALGFLIVMTIMVIECYIDEPKEKVENIVVDKLADILVLCIKNGLPNSQNTKEEQKNELRNILLNPKTLNREMTWVNFNVIINDVIFTNLVVEELIEPSIKILNNVNKKKDVGFDPTNYIKARLESEIHRNDKLSNAIHGLLVTEAKKESVQQLN